MKLHEETGRLLRGEVFKSAADAIYRASHPLTAAEVLKSVDQRRLRELMDANTSADHKYKPNDDKRYTEVPKWVQASIRRAQDLRLFNRPKPLRILDLGSGGGFFLLVSRYLGHSGIGVDLPDSSIFSQLFELFGLERVLSRINAHEPLPEGITGKFDLVTAFCIVFNGHKTKKVWGPAEWEFFLNDVETRLLNPGGEIHLLLNAELDNTVFTPELRKFFRARGGRFKRCSVHLKPRI